jgi:hypothetical protein
MNVSLGDTETWPYNRGVLINCINCNKTFAHHHFWACPGSGINGARFPPLTSDCYYSKLQPNKRYLTVDMQPVASAVQNIKQSVSCTSCNRKLKLEPSNLIAFNATGQCGGCRISSGAYYECKVCLFSAIPKGYKDCLVCKYSKSLAASMPTSKQTKAKAQSTNEWKLWRDSGINIGAGECSCGGGTLKINCKYHIGT